jgi:hypothetical protein
MTVFRRGRAKDTQRHGEEADGMIEAEIGAVCLPAKEYQRLWATTRS